jgi:type II secretory pathway pseudopilin PulG
MKMKPKTQSRARCSPRSWPSTDQAVHQCGTAGRQAFTLVELIGVVAVIFILALAVMPAVLKQIYDAERTHELANLQTLGGALRSLVLATRIIPGTNTVATDLASQLGWAVADVQTNGRGVVRCFIADPATRIGTNTSLPYIQTNILAANLPTNQPTNRFMIITTLRSVLPVSITRGCATNTVAFQNAWDSDDGVRPTNWTDGNWGDIMIQRVNLQQLFTQVILNSIVTTNDVSSTATNGHFSLDNTNNHVALPRAPFSTYLLQGTKLGLHANDGALQLLQVIQGAGRLTNGAPYYPGPSFVYEKGNAAQGAGSWRGKLFLGTAAQQLKGADLQGAYEIFMSGPLRANAGSVTQNTLTWNFYNYMSNYVYWANNAFAANKKTGVSNSFNAIKSDLSYYCK